MVYFLGRDVKVAICTEDADKSIVQSAATPDVAAVGTDTTGDIIEFLWAADGNAFDGGSNHNPFTDVTGVDLTLGKVDEDIAYMGQRTALKAEIKKDTSVTLTRKKKNDVFDAVFNDARFGIQADGSGLRDAAAGAPDDNNYGYRVYVKMKDNSEVFVMRNCCITGHAVTLNADGVTEETIELMSYVNPIIKAADADCIAATDAGDL